MKRSVKIIEFPIQIFQKDQARLLSELPGIEPDYENSVVAIDVDQIASVHRSKSGTGIEVKSGIEWFTVMPYESVMEIWLNVMRLESEVQFFSYKDRENIAKTN